MKLLRSIELGDDFEIEDDIVQSVEDDPCVIFEQLVFQSSLDFADCVARLKTVLSAALGADALAGHSVQNGAVEVTNFFVRNRAQEAFVQVSSEDPNVQCGGFIRITTVWAFGLRS
jgi:hypothetical protein